MLFFRPLGCVWLAINSMAACSLVAAEPAVDFSRDVRPILADTCLRCHGQDAKQRQSGLRLDIREEALKPAESGEAAIVPGKAAESSLVARVFSADESERMPPTDSQKKLTSEQKSLLKRWV